MDSLFCTLGMFTLDDVHFSDAQLAESQSTSPVKRSQFGVLGGAGTYALLGARLFLPGNRACQAGMVIHLGSDFPPDILSQLNSWSTSSQFVHRPTELTVRAKNTYLRDLRLFEFITPKTQIWPLNLDDGLLKSSSFHIIGTPERCIRVVKEIAELRSRFSGLVDPIFVWEPMEHSCSPEHLEAFLHAMRLVDTFSPNEDEFAKLIGLNTNGEHIRTEDLSTACEMLLQRSKVAAIVVRLGAHGSYIAEKKRVRHFPAYYEPTSDKTSSNTQVVDVTGGGNAFLGAYTLGLCKPPSTISRQDAVIMGTVAASYAIQQVGLPSLSATDDEREVWNDEAVEDRTTLYKNRIAHR